MECNTIFLIIQLYSIEPIEYFSIHAFLGPPGQVSAAVAVVRSSGRAMHPQQNSLNSRISLNRRINVQNRFRRSSRRKRLLTTVEIIGGRRAPAKHRSGLRLGTHCFYGSAASHSNEGQIADFSGFLRNQDGTMINVSNETSLTLRLIDR